MKRIIALLTVMMMLLSCVAVSATENVVEEFWNVMMNNRITEGSLDMNAKISFDMPILDTRREKNLLGTFISDLILALLSYVAESEYRTIHQRQAEGSAAAKARGFKFGRPPKPLPENFHEVYQKWKTGKLSVAEAARQCGMPRYTFYYKAQVYKNATYIDE